MTARLVSPDRKLFLVAGEDDLKAVAKLYNLTSKQIGNIRQLLGWAGVGNRSGDRNDPIQRKESENFMLFHSVIWLKHDDGTEYVPLVGKHEHMFNSVVAARTDMNFGSKGSMTKLLNESRKHIGRWRKVSPPRQAYSLGNGSSLVGLQACAALAPDPLSDPVPPSPCVRAVDRIKWPTASSTMGQRAHHRAHWRAA